MRRKDDSGMDMNDDTIRQMGWRGRGYEFCVSLGEMGELYLNGMVEFRMEKWDRGVEVIFEFEQ